MTAMRFIDNQDTEKQNALSNQRRLFSNSVDSSIRDMLYQFQGFYAAYSVILDA